MRYHGFVYANFNSPIYSYNKVFIFSLSKTVSDLVELSDLFDLALTFP